MALTAFGKAGIGKMSIIETGFAPD